MADYGDVMMRNPNAALQARTKAQSRANVMQLKMMGSSHPTGLTGNLLKLFEPRPPLEYKLPPEKRKCPPYSGMAQFVSNFAEPGDPQYALPVDKGETPGQRRARIHQLRLEEGAKKAAEELEKYDPSSDPNATGDPYKTLFVAKLNYETTESRIKKEFEAYGPIKRVRLVTDKDTNKPRGYAFVEYVHTRDMKAAYKQADGKKIDNRRVLVDVERGRTVPNWRPRRLGGGLGTTRVAVEEVTQIPVGREQVQSGGVSRSEEPKVRDERDREKSRERGRDREREREKSRERSHDRPRDRERKDDRHHRDRDRTRDHGDRDKDRTRDRDRERDRTRDRGRDREHRDRHREKGRSKDRERDYDVADDHDRGISRERDRNYGSVGVEDIHGSDRAGHGRPEKEHVHGDYDYYETEGRGHYDDKDGEYDRYGESHRDNDRYDQMDEDGYGYDRTAVEPQDNKRRSNRSISREYEY